MTLLGMEAHLIFRGARLILEAYWATLGGKPTKDSKPVTKKRGRQSTGAASEPTPSAKRQKKPGRKSKGASEDKDGTSEPPAGFTEVGEDEWEPPKPLDRAWDSAVQSVDTIEKDDQGELWAYLLWNDKNEDGRFYRSKARLAVCNKACPQRVCIMENINFASVRIVKRRADCVALTDVAVLREACVSSPQPLFS